MARMEGLQLEELPAEGQAMMAQAKELMGFTPNDALLMARKPEMLQAASGLVNAIYRTGAVDMELKRLVGMMSSSAAGCQYCTAHTAHGADLGGAATEKIESIWEFRTSPLFTAAERAALEVAAGAGQSPNAVTDEQFEELRRYYNDDQVLEIVGVIALFGFLNRWNHTLAIDLEDAPRDFANKHLAAKGWEAGVHGGSQS